MEPQATGAGAPASSAETARPETTVAEPLGVERDLRENPHAFGFFQAVRLLQRLHAERTRVGEFGRPAEEVVRFGVSPSLAFAAGEIQDLEPPAEGPSRMEVNFMGLVGNQGVLPSHYSLLALQERGRDERPLTDFLDMFHHRMLSLFYRAWERARFYVPLERGGSDRVSEHLLDLVGLGQAAARAGLPVRDRTFLSYCGLLGMRQRSATALRQILEDYFQVPVQVEEFIGGWYPLSRSYRCRVDEDAPEDGAGLGQGAAVGDEIWDPQARVRIRLGPLARERYDEFLPGGPAHEALAAITRFFSDGQFDFELQLVLSRDEVPSIVLGEDRDEEPPPLGWCTWLRTRPLGRDADETTLSLQGA